METENINQPTNNPIVSPVQPQVQPVPNSLMNQKGFLPLMFGILILLVVIGGGAYYLGTQKSGLTNQVIDNRNNAQVQPSPTQLPQTQPTTYVSPSPVNITWKTESVQIKKETAVSGNENINLSIQLPSTWTLKTVSKPTNPDNLIKNCAEYVIASDDSTTTFTISPVCTGWSAEYLDWPQSAVVIKEEKNVGNDGHTAYTVRYLDTATSQIKYVDGEKGTSNKIMDAILITYNTSTGNFLPTRIVLKYSGTKSESLFELTDKIVTSIKAQ